MQLQYAAKLHSNEENPTRSIIEDCWQNYATYPRGREPFATKTRKILEIIGDGEKIIPNCYPNYPFWHSGQPTVDTSLAASLKLGGTDNISIKKATEAKIEEYKNSMQIYTDGSKLSDNKTGIAFRIPSTNDKRSYRLQDDLTVSTIEAAAIQQALTHLPDTPGTGDVTIFTDSLEVLESVDKNRARTSTSTFGGVRDAAIKTGKHINLVWIPSHVGILEHENTDDDAKHAATRDKIDLFCANSIKDANKKISQYIDRIWQTKWDESEKGKSYRNIEPTATRKIKHSQENRKREVIITRLRFQKCNMNAYLHIIGKHADGNCDICHVPETVEHFILHCKKNRTLIDNLTKSTKQLKISLETDDILKNKETLDIVVDYIIKTKRKI